jgi:hypothetical protein
MRGVEPLVKTIYLWNRLTTLMTIKSINTEEIVDAVMELSIDAIYGCASR